MAKAKAKKQPDPLRVINNRYEPECPLDRLSLFSGNPRQGDIGQIHQSYEHNGFYGAIVAQESTGKILAGNHRYQAAAQRGATSIPVIWIDCDDATAKRILVSDNRHSDLASYDTQALAELLEQIKIDETQLGLLGTGWDEESQANLLADLSGPIFGEEPKDEHSEGASKPATCPNCGYSL